jgi:hypothetical protein
MQKRLKATLKKSPLTSSAVKRYLEFKNRERILNCNYEGHKFYYLQKSLVGEVFPRTRPVGYCKLEQKTHRLSRQTDRHNAAFPEPRSSRAPASRTELDPRNEPISTTTQSSGSDEMTDAIASPYLEAI